ncbi:MAG TPA: amino acid adenylation domain-containing protein [Gemmatimonadales bacterium]|nr:amino acid adenylation domain-containing protein [Gemmatimonadales bacterium]
MRGRLDPGVLEAALNIVVARHEALRTVFALEGETPVQVVRPHAHLPIPTIDLAKLPAAERDAAADAAYQSLAYTPFDLGRGPLLRLGLIRLGETEWILAVVFHHIVADGVSAGLFLAELERGYAALTAGRTPDLPGLALQYADFAVWQEKQLAGRKAAQQLAWWREQLAGPVPALELPTDFPRPPFHSFNGARVTASVPGDLADSIRALGKSEGATPFMVFLAAFQVLLYKHANQEDLIVGVITAGRQRSELEPLIGLFLNTLAIRTSLAGDPSFREILRRTRDAALGALDHQDVPFDVVAQAVAPAPDRSRSPVFQAGFQFLEGMAKEFSLPGLDAVPYRGEKHTAPFDLSLFLFGGQSGGALRATLNFGTDLFDSSTAQRLLARYVTLLESIAADPTRPVRRLGMLPKAERDLVLETWNATDAILAVPRVLHEGLERHADTTPDAPAVAYDGGTLSYAQLDRRANRLAHRLAARGVGPGTGVGICAKLSADGFTAILATLKTGAHYVPLDPDAPADRLAFLVADSGVRVILADPRARDRLPGTGPVILELEGLDEAGPDHRPESRATPDSLAYVIYTSGSTGQPKGVMVPHRAAANTIAAFCADHGITAGDVVLQSYPLVFDPSVWVLFFPLLAGACAVIPRAGADQAPQDMHDTIRRHGVTILPLVPTLLQLLLEVPGLGECRTLRHLFCGGEALAGDLLRRVAATLPGARFTNLYGPTEAAIFVTQWTWDGKPFEGIAPIGRPISNCRVYVLDPEGQPVPAGVPGEAYLAGAGVALGYLNRPELDREKFLPDPFRAGQRMYRSGDLVRWRSGGDLEFLGRLDDQVKLRGYRIELGEVEAVLGSAPGVQGVVVLLREDAPGDRRLVAYVSVAGATPPTATSLRTHARGRLPEYMVPSHLVILNGFPRTSNGKVDRAALPVPGPREVDATDSALPGSALERQIAATMEDVLQRTPIGRDDDFFRLGGHSLLAIRLLGRLRGAMAPELSLQAIFEHPTAAGLAAAMEAGGWCTGAASERIPRRSDRTRAPLSFGQEMLWVQAAMEPGLPSYNVPLLLRLHGALDGDAMERAVSGLAARHEPLRTAFIFEDGDPVQLIRDATPVALERIDLSGTPDPESESLAAARQAAARPFDLAEGSLLRATLYRLGPDEHLLMLVTHHIATDGWSMSVLRNDLAALYESAVSGRPAALPPLPLQYGDLAAWERNRLRGERLERLLAFWKAELEGAPRGITLPTDRPAGAASSGPGARCHMILSPERLEQIRRTGETAGATLYMTVLAAWTALLHRYSGQDDILVGAPSAGRLPETESLVGFLVNTLMLRITVDPAAPFQQLLEEVRRASVAAYDHDGMPLGRLAQALRADGDDSPWFQVTFTFQGTLVSAREFPGLRIEPAGAHLGSANFALGLIAREAPEGLAISLEYRTDLFDRDTIERMLGHLRTLLEGITTRPDCAVGRLPLLVGAERHRVLEDWNATARAYTAGGTLTDLLEQQAVRTPEAEAIRFADTTLTYAQLHGRANQLAHRLRRLGVGPGVLTGICAERSLELIVGLLAVLKAGGAYVPLDPEYPADRLGFMLEDADVPVLLTQRHLRSLLPASGAAVLDLEPDAFDAEPTSRLEESAGPDDPAYMIYTSGSTGRPKGALNSHRGIVNRLLWMQETFVLTGNDVVLQKTPMSFDVSVWEFFWPLLSGARLVLAEPSGHRDPLYLAELIARERVTISHFVPSMLLAFLAEPAAAACTSLRDVMCSGEALPIEAARQFRQMLPARLHNLYGPTEAAIDVTWWQCDPGYPRAVVPIGRPIANTTTYILDPLGQPVPVGIPGELFLGGVQVGMGYWNRPELTTERFVPDPFGATSGARLYRTGDRARYLPDGNIEYLGRLDFQVKIRGFRIELGEIEAVLAAHPGVTAAVVVALDDAVRGPRLVAYFVPNAAQPADVPALRTHLQQVVPDYMIPSAFVALPILPLTPSGKVDRRALPVPTAWADRAVKTFQAPVTPLEEAIAGIFAEVLGRPGIGVGNSFFELGGHSLQATQVVGRASQLFRVKLPLRDFFEAPTVAGLAATMMRYEQKPGQVLQIAELLRSIEAMPEAERNALRQRGADAPQRGRP